MVRAHTASPNPHAGATQQAGNAPASGKPSKTSRAAAIAAGSLSRRVRATLSLPIDARTDADLAVLDDIMWASPACAHLTRGLRLRLAQGAVLATYEDGQALVSAGDPMQSVFFVTSGEVEIAPAPGRSAASPNGSSGSSGSSRTPRQQQQQQEHTQAAYMLGPGTSLGAFQHPIQLDPCTPRTRQLGLQMPQPRWPLTATAHGGQVECAVVSHDVWAAALAESTYWDAREVASFLEDVPVFGRLTPAQLLGVARQVRGGGG